MHPLHHLSTPNFLLLTPHFMRHEYSECLGLMHGLFTNFSFSHEEVLYLLVYPRVFDIAKGFAITITFFLYESSLKS